MKFPYCRLRNILQNLMPPLHTPPLPTSSTELDVFVPTCGTFTHMNLLSTLPSHIPHTCCSQPRTPHLRLVHGCAVSCAETSSAMWRETGAPSFILTTPMGVVPHFPTCKTKRKVQLLLQG